jgi:hypothetical protein
VDLELREGEGVHKGDKVAARVRERGIYSCRIYKWLLLRFHFSKWTYIELQGKRTLVHAKRLFYPSVGYMGQGYPHRPYIRSRSAIGPEVVKEEAHEG